MSSASAFGSAGLITLTSTLITVTPDITKTSSNNCFISCHITWGWTRPILHRRFKIFWPSRRTKHVNNWGILCRTKNANIFSKRKVNLCVFQEFKRKGETNNSSNKRKQRGPKIWTLMGGFHTMVTSEPGGHQHSTCPLLRRLIPRIDNQN